MSGYTPVFDSVYEGTLCGQWPALPVWMTILPMADKNGRIDKTPQAISALTGWPLDILTQGLEQLCMPDSRSRSKAEEGARLKLLDADRDWGWQVVNHSKYREKARLLAKDTARTESGADAERKRQSRAVPRCPPDSPSQTHTQTHTQTQTQTSDSEVRGDARGEPRATRSAASRFPKDWELTEDRKAYASAQGIDPAATFENFRDYWTAASGAKARK